MVFIITKDTTKEELDTFLSMRASSKQAATSSIRKKINLAKYSGKIKFNMDGLAYQKKKEMPGVRVIADTNALIYLFDGNKRIINLFSDKEIMVTSISEIELLSFPGLSGNDKKTIRSFLSECLLIELDNAIKEATISLREKIKMKLPDAIIAASALYWEAPLFTADKGFRKVNGLDVVLIDI